MCGVVLGLVWVPSELQPGDPMSRVNSVFAGAQTKAESQAWEVWGQLLSRLGDYTVWGSCAPGNPEKGEGHRPEVRLPAS